jgi:hypothetical protein
MWIGIGCLGWLGLSYGYAWWYLREKEYAFGALIFGGWSLVAVIFLITISPWDPGIIDSLLYGSGGAGLCAVAWFLIGTPSMNLSSDYDHSREILFFRKPGGF